jgi:CRP-like cAMP-binding protein
VRYEYSKPNKGDMNLTVLYEATKDLEFFTKFPKDAINKLYMMAEHEVIPKGTTIFKQDEIGDMMYIILRGCVVVEKTAANTGPCALIVNSLFDGT